jgi:hypothetical protein
MTIEFDISKLSDRARRVLLIRANQWVCTPAEALARILEDRAKRDKTGEAA